MKTTLEITIAGLAGLSLASPLGGPVAIAAVLVALVVAAAVHFTLYGIDS